MTEQETDEQARLDSELPPDVDWVLSSVVDYCNRTNLTFGVTLHCGGSCVSGEMVPARKYFERLAEEQSSHLEDDVSRDFMKRFFMGYAKDAHDPDSDTEKRPGWARYIHLLDARIWHPGNEGMPTNRGLTWRGRLSAIDGFSFGTFGPPRHT